MKRLFTFILMICAACVASAANYLTFTAEEDSSTFGIVNNENNPDVQYSLDGGETWTALAVGDTVTLAHKGDKVLLKGNNPDGFSKGRDEHSSFSMSGKIAASGSVMSLIDGLGLSTEISGRCCFYRLFHNCTSLTQAPELPATTLAIGCYLWMFNGCTSLTHAPELPATTLAESCYSSMFFGCTSLTQAPELPATTLANYCYEWMFSGCTSLSQISVSFDDWGYSTYDWVKNVAPTGTFIYPKDLPLAFGNSRIPREWKLKTIIDGDTVDATFDTNYLTFTAEEDSSTFGIVNKNNNPDLQYSLDGGETWTALTEGDKVTLAHKGDKALLRGGNPDGFFLLKTIDPDERNIYTNYSSFSKIIDSDGRNIYTNYSSFSMTGKIAASGSVMSLIDGLGLSTEIPEVFCFYRLFSGCTSLTQAPELPATTLADGCYFSMFAGCTNLTQISVSFDDWNGTSGWVSGVAPAGTFICPKALAEEYGANRIPHGWRLKNIIDGDTVDVTPNTNYLTFTAEEDGSTFGIVNYGFINPGPDLQYSIDDGETWTALTKGDTVTLAHKGDKALLRGGNPDGFFSRTIDPEKHIIHTNYSSFSMTGKIAASGSVMSLIDGAGLSTEIPEAYCFYNLFSGCTSLTQAPELPATTLAEGCYEWMFSGCTSLTEAPELPAMTLAKRCYEDMFSGCTSLSQISVSFDDWNDSSYTVEWVADVAPTGTFICPKALAEEYGVNRIPEGWTVKYIDDNPTEVSDVATDGMNVWTEGLTIIVSGATGRVEVLDASGAKLKSESSAGDACTFTMPAHGVYLVRTSKRTVKVVL